MISQLFIAVVIGGLLCFLLSKAFIQISQTTRIMLDDSVGESRRIHKDPTPRIGGITFLFSFGLAFYLIVPNHYWNNQQIQGFMVGAVLIALLGIIDDVKSLGGKLKLIGQITITLLVVWGFGIYIPFINNPLTNGIIDFPLWISIVVSVVWILGTTNVMNFVDGIDGLATSITLSFSIVLLIVALLFQQSILAIIVALLMGCCLGFLPINSHRATAFLGDGGSMFLGYSIGVLSILSGAKLATAMLVIGLPALDVLNTFWIRIKHGQSLFIADNEHLHYRLLKKGLSVREIVFIISGISVIFGVIALTNDTVFKTLGLIVLITVSQALIYWSLQE